MLVFIWVTAHFLARPTDWGDLSQALMYHQVRAYDGYAAGVISRGDSGGVITRGDSGGSSRDDSASNIGRGGSGGVSVGICGGCVQ